MASDVKSCRTKKYIIMGPETAELQLHNGFWAVVTKARRAKVALDLERALFEVAEDKGMK